MSKEVSSQLEESLSNSDSLQLNYGNNMYTGQGEPMFIQDNEKNSEKYEDLVNQRGGMMDYNQQTQTPYESPF